MLKNRTILISGLGVGGPALAWWLRRYGFEPTIVEIAPEPRTGGYMIDFWGVGYEVATRMGLLPQLEQAGYKIDEVRMVNKNGRKVAGIDGDLFRTAVSGGFLSIPRGDLAFSLWRSIEGQTPVIFGDRITSLKQENDGVSVTFQHAPPQTFDLVIGADGLHSNVRQIAFGPDEDFEKHLGYWVASFTTRHYPHRDEGTYTSYTQPGRQIARYALRDGRTAFLLVWTDQHNPPPDRHDEAGQKQFTRNAFADMEWEWPQIVPALETTDDFYFDPISQVKAPSWSSGRIALLGDAAWCPSLLAGEGTAFAIAGAYILAGELARAQGDISAFKSYEGVFRSFIEDKQKAAVGFAGQFAPKTQLALWLRNFVVNLLSIPVLGKRLANNMFDDNLTLPDYSALERTPAE